ncbi:MAG: hypothetical protein OXB93_02630 [Cytophagales bacterium]|nr:hypothetical protein [Cytophagales bacterium]
MNSFFPSLLFTCMASLSYAIPLFGQDEPIELDPNIEIRRGGKRDAPDFSNGFGFGFGWGWNLLSQASEELAIHHFPSSRWNFSLGFEIPIISRLENLNLRVGGGIYNRRFNFRNNITLSKEDDYTKIVPASEVFQVEVEDVKDLESQYSVRSLEISIGLRNKFFKSEGNFGFFKDINMELGGFAGRTLRDLSQVNYTPNENVSRSLSVRDRRAFRYPYGTYLKLGSDFLSLVFEQHFSPLFQGEQSPRAMGSSVGLELWLF